jgi:hypothetical protein
MPGKEINPLAGGHTRSHGHVVCSEVYRTVTIRGKTWTMKGRDAARLAFHECFHNLRPNWNESDLMGHGGFAETPLDPDLGEWDIATMSRQIAVKGKYTQQT